MESRPRKQKQTHQPLRKPGADYALHESNPPASHRVLNTRLRRSSSAFQQALDIAFPSTKNGGSRTHIGRDLTYSRADSYYLDILSCHDSRIRHQQFHLEYEDFMTIFEEQERKFPPLNNVAPNEQTSCEMVGESATSGISQHLTVKKRRTVSSVNTSIPSLDLLQMSVQTLRASCPNIGPPIQRQ